MTTATPSPLRCTSSSTHSAPAARPCRNDSIVFSGACAALPRWPMMGLALGSRSGWGKQHESHQPSARWLMADGCLLELILQPRHQQATDLRCANERDSLVVGD